MMRCRAIVRDYFDSTCERLCITQSRRGNECIFFHHCFRRFPFTIVYAHSLPLSTLTRPSFPLSSASLHRKRITFFFPRVGDFRICFRKQRATARDHGRIFVFWGNKSDTEREKEVRTHTHVYAKIKFTAGNYLIDLLRNTIDAELFRIGENREQFANCEDRWRAIFSSRNVMMHELAINEN